MLADDGLGLDDFQRVGNPRGNAEKNNEDQSIEAIECRAPRRFSLQHIELMAQGDDLRFPRGARSEQPHEDRPAPPIACCCPRAFGRIKRRDSNRYWMKVRWQVNSTILENINRFDAARHGD